MPDRATFRIAGAIAQVDKKFTKKEGKPFAVVWLEDLTGTLEVVIWNELYLECAEKLVPGNVVGIRGKLDLRDESLRATAGKIASSFRRKFRVIQIPTAVGRRRFVCIFRRMRVAMNCGRFRRCSRLRRVSDRCNWFSKRQREKRCESMLAQHFTSRSQPSSRNGCSAG